MSKLLRLIRSGKELMHLVSGKRDTISRGQVTLEARANVNNLEWCLADNISEISVKRSKKARSLMSRAPR